MENSVWKESSLPYVIVNSFGECKRLQTEVVETLKSGVKYKRVLAERYIVPVDNGTGYYQIKVEINSIRYRKYLHVIVWEAFNGEIPEGFEIDHIDCDKSNNKLSNLQLVTRKENMLKCHKDNPHIIFNLKQFSYKKN